MSLPTVSLYQINKYVSQTARYFITHNNRTESSLSRIDEPALLLSVQVWMLFTSVFFCSAGYLLGIISGIFAVSVVLGALFVLVHTATFAHYYFSCQGALEAAKMGRIFVIASVAKFVFLMMALALVSLFDSKMLIGFVVGLSLLQLAPFVFAHPLFAIKRKF